MRIFENRDCMEGMKEYPDKYFDLAIVDPPYGIGANKMQLGNGKRKVYRGEADWDAEIPSVEYFNELQRVSKNQIIWGGNYFIMALKSSPCWIVWDKGTGENSFADGELAWTSFESPLRIFKQSWVGANAKERNEPDRIHPTQKPKQLYKFLIKHYAHLGYKILDTHVGSASSLIAYEEEGYDYVGYEIDKKYYDNAVKRIEQYRSQLKLF